MVILPRPRGAWLPQVVLIAAAVTACTRPAGDGAKPIRLVDTFDAKSVKGASTKAVPIPRTEWRFDGPAPSPPPPPPPPAKPLPAPFPATRGWEAGPGISGLAIRDGLLVGRTTTGFPILHVERTAGLENADQVHAVEIRLRASSGANLSLTTSPAPTIDLPRQLALTESIPWVIKTPLLPGDKMQTYTITPPAPVSAPRIRHILLRPTDAAGADFAIESVRLVLRREHLASVPSGVSWQGLPRHLPRDAHHTVAGNGPVRPDDAGTAGPRPVDRHSGGRTRDVSRRRTPRRQGDSHTDAHGDQPVPLGAAVRGSGGPRRPVGRAFTLGDLRQGRHDRFLGRACRAVARGEGQQERGPRPDRDPDSRGHAAEGPSGRLRLRTADGPGAARAGEVGRSFATRSRKTSWTKARCLRS